MAYTTLAKVKAYLGIPTGTTDDDTLLDDLILRAVDIIESETGNNFEPVTETRYFDHTYVHYRTLNLEDFLQTVTTLTNGDGNVISNSDYTLMPKNRSAYTQIVLKSSVDGFTFEDLHDSFISVAGTWGIYSAVPKDVEHYTIRLVSYLYKQKDNHQDLDRTLIAGNTTILPQSMPMDMFNFFRRYRKIF